MVWTYPGVESYYKNSKGRIVVNNPFRILDVWQATEVADLKEYHCSSDAQLLARATAR